MSHIHDKRERGSSRQEGGLLKVGYDAEEELSPYRAWHFHYWLQTIEIVDEGIEWAITFGFCY